MPTLSCKLVVALVASAAVGPLASAHPPVRVEFLDAGTVVPEGLPFSEAVRVGDVLYLSGQIGNRPGTMELVDGGVAGQTRQAMRNIETILKAHGYRLDDVIKCSVMLADMQGWGEFNEAYRTFFDARYPARSAMGVNGLALGAQVEIECTAARGG